MQLLHAHSPAAWGLVRLPLQLTLEIGADVVTALRHSHRSCNRDLTPSNIYMVGGRAKVAFKPQWLSSTKVRETGGHLVVVSVNHWSSSCLLLTHESLSHHCVPRCKRLLLRCDIVFAVHMEQMCTSY